MWGRGTGPSGWGRVGGLITQSPAAPTPGTLPLPPDAGVPYREPGAPTARAGAVGLPGAWCRWRPRPRLGQRREGWELSWARARGTVPGPTREEGAWLPPPPPPPAPDRISTTASAWRRRRGSPRGAGGGGAGGAAYRKVSSKGAEDPAAGGQPPCAAASSEEGLPC